MVTKGTILHSRSWRYHLLQEGLCVHGDARLRYKNVISLFFSWNVRIINLCSKCAKGFNCCRRRRRGNYLWRDVVTWAPKIFSETHFGTVFPFLRLERGGQTRCTALFFFFLLFLLFSWHVCLSAVNNFNCCSKTFTESFCVCSCVSVSSLHGVLNQIVSQAVVGERRRKKNRTRGPDTRDTEKEEKGFGQSCSSSAQHESNEAEEENIGRRG